MTAKVLVDDHWFEEALFEWANSPRATLSSLALGRRSPDATQLEALRRCLEPQLGAPEAMVTDYIKGKRSYRWSARTHPSQMSGLEAIHLNEQ